VRFDEHFTMRKLIGTKLKDYIRSNGILKGIVLYENRNFSHYFR
jgi:hypothetical protein